MFGWSKKKKSPVEEQEACFTLQLPPVKSGTSYFGPSLLVSGKIKGTGDIELLEELGQQIKAGSLCQLGQTAPNPVLTTLRYFRDEYEAHMNHSLVTGNTIHRTAAQTNTTALAFILQYVE